MSFHWLTTIVGRCCGLMNADAESPQVEGARMSSANQWADLEGAVGCFTSAVIDCRSPCSVTPDRPCHIVRQLAAWNEMLFPARMQLRAIPGARGKLALVNVDNSRFFMGEPEDFQLQKGAGVAHQLLKHHRCVESLCIESFQFQRYTQPLRDALPYACLKKLKMTCLASVISDGLWAAIPSLTSLEELDCSFFCCCSNYRSTELSNALATLVRTSPSLVVLCLTGISMEEQATKDLLAGLTENGLLRDLTLGMWVIPETCRKELAQYLMRTPSLMSFSYTGDNENTEIAVLEGILHNRTISTVKISTFTGHTIPRGNLAVCSALAEYVQSTSVLRKLEARTGRSDEQGFSDEWWHIIVRSLSRNKSIRELTFNVDDMSVSNVESLAETVKASRNIRKLTFGDMNMLSLRAFVKRLSADIVQNRTLLDVVLEGWLYQGGLDAFRNVFAISEVTRRNSDLLAAAAAFPKATEVDRRSTAALERIYKLHAELLEDLAELVDVSAAEIGAMAHRHLQRTASLDEYMRTTGVVKERVKCHPRDDRRMQLDDLGEDCWALVRRFLMLDDVEEAVTHQENL
ncbi:hypothetical protein HPB52_013530 [Rhipicephalus sanguineus]|uniref:Nlr family card domain protein n=1 Tax=Rhipicephalus sanguineus TaxID=34632 RepID=A0A9D4T3N4_RHISA|nr:hypothetical protein HPB52_013530 [Rhipicephalus sanguineus]